MEKLDYLRELINAQNAYFTKFTAAQAKDLLSVLDESEKRTLLEFLFADPKNRYKGRNYNISDLLFYFWLVVNESIERKSKQTRINGFVGDRYEEVELSRMHYLRDLKEKLPKWAKVDL